MRAVILAGGFGTRLRPLTLTTPKPLLPLINRPFVSHQIEQLRRQGIREVVLAVSYKASHFRKLQRTVREIGVKLTLVEEKVALGTGGAIRNAFVQMRAHLTHEPVFVLNGDILADIHIGQMWRHHFMNQASATLAVIKVPDARQFGVILMDRKGKIRRFVEKPPRPPAQTINAGIYLIDPSLIRFIPAGRPVSVEKEVFPRVLSRGERLYGFLLRGRWRDVGTVQSYWDIHRELLRNRWLIGAGSQLGSGIKKKGFVCLGPRCVLGKKVTLSNSILLKGTTVGESAHVEGAVIGQGARIGHHAKVGFGTVLGDNAVVPPYSQIGMEK